MGYVRPTVASLLSLLGATLVFGQQTQFVQFSDTGVIVRAEPGAIVMLREGGGNISVSLTPQAAVRKIGPPTIEVSAILRPEQVEVGMTAQFQGVLNDEGAIAQPLSELSVSVIPSRGNMAPKPAPTPEAKNAVKVTGPITAYEDGKLSVAVKGGTVAARTTEATKIILRGADPRRVKPGDKVFVRGFSKATQMQAPVYYAQFVSIELAEAPPADPLADPPKNKPDAQPVKPEVGEDGDVQILKVN